LTLYVLEQLQRTPLLHQRETLRLQPNPPADRGLDHGHKSGIMGGLYLLFWQCTEILRINQSVP
jgi:hypothetical protein